MSMLDAHSLGSSAAQDPQERVSRSLDALVYKQLLQAAGLEKGLTGMAGMVFTDVLAEQIAKSAQTPLMQLDPKKAGLAAGAHSTSALRASDAVTSGFGVRADPFTHQPHRHEGVDVAASEGSPIPAVWGGTVVQAGERGGYGNAVEIDHGNGVHTLYAHAKALTVKEGDQVAPGDVIANVGSTGRSTGPHLHLELRVNGRAVDPQTALKAYGERAEGVK